MENLKETSKEIFHEVYEIIPLIQEKVRLCLHRELTSVHHDQDQIVLERSQITTTKSLVQGKWTLDILYLLNIFQEAHYNDIKRKLSISSRILTDRLKLLQMRKLITRSVEDSKPIRTTYSLTDLGRNFLYLLVPVFLFGIEHDI